jgi:transcriptional regulator with XRE-family HTH domain
MNDSAAKVRARREELQNFLRVKRARVVPADAGVEVVGRRRTSGLTREDVAYLAGVSFKWYGRFESGMAAGVSRGFLERISNALQLSRAECSHLYYLCGFSAPQDEATSPEAPSWLQAVVDEFVNVPALVFSSLYEVLCYNWTYDRVFQQSAQPPGVQSNGLWRMFFDTQLRGSVGQWEHVARGSLAELRHLNRGNLEAPAFQSLIEELSKSPDFVRIWNTGPVPEELGKAHPFSALGLTFKSYMIVQSENPRLMLVTLIPADRENHARLAAICDQ